MQFSAFTDAAVPHILMHKQIYRKHPLVLEACGDLTFENKMQSCILSISFTYTCKY